MSLPPQGVSLLTLFIRHRTCYHTDSIRESFLAKEKYYGNLYNVRMRELWKNRLIQGEYQRVTPSDHSHARVIPFATVDTFPLPNPTLHFSFSLSGLCLTPPTYQTHISCLLYCARYLHLLTWYYLRVPQLLFHLFFSPPPPPRETQVCPVFRCR